MHGNSARRTSTRRPRQGHGSRAQLLDPQDLDPQPMLEHVVNLGAPPGLDRQVSPCLPEIPAVAMLSSPERLKV
jgi:hypothetical protein